MHIKYMIFIDYGSDFSHIYGERTTDGYTPFESEADCERYVTWFKADYPEWREEGINIHICKILRSEYS